MTVQTITDIEIRKADSTIRATVPVCAGSKRIRQLQTDDCVKVKFTSPYPIALRLGDYCDIAGWGRFCYVKRQKPTRNKTNGGWDYELQLDAEYLQFKNKICKYQATAGGQECSWTLTATAEQHLAQVMQNITRLCQEDALFKYHGTAEGKEWAYSVDHDQVDSSAKTITYDKLNIIDAITAIAEAYECEWWVDDNIFKLGKCDIATEYLEWEADHELESVNSTQSKDQYASRIIPFGSTRNISTRYRRDLVFTVTDVDGDCFRDSQRALNPKWFKSAYRSVVDVRTDYTSALVNQYRVVEAADKMQTAVSDTWNTTVILGNISATQYDILFRDDTNGIFTVPEVARVEEVSNGNTPPARTVTLSVYIQGRDADGNTYTTEACVKSLKLETQARNEFHALTDSTAGTDYSVEVGTDLTDAYLCFDLTIEYTATKYRIHTAWRWGKITLRRHNSEVTIAQNVVVESGGRSYVCNFNPYHTTESDRQNWFECTAGHNLAVGDEFTVSTTYLSHGKVNASFFRSRYSNADVLTNGVVTTNLMLPETVTPYIDLIAGLTLPEAVEDVVVFDDVYPRYNDTVLEIRKVTRTAEKDDENGQTVYESYDAYQIRGLMFTALRDAAATAIDSYVKNGVTLGADTEQFDKEYIIDGTSLQIKFEKPRTYSDKTADDYGEQINADGGKLDGWAFDASLVTDYDDEGNSVLWIELVRDTDTEVPNPYICPEIGDTFILQNFNIAMVDDLLIETAELELKETADRYVEELKEDTDTYECPLLSDVAKGTPCALSWAKNYAEGGRITTVKADSFDEDTTTYSTVLCSIDTAALFLAMAEADTTKYTISFDYAAIDSEATARITFGIEMITGFQDTKDGHYVASFEAKSATDIPATMLLTVTGDVGRGYVCVQHIKVEAGDKATPWRLTDKEIAVQQELTAALALGSRVRLINPALFATVRDSRILGYEIPLDIPYDTPKYTVGEKAKYSRFGAIEDDVEAIKAATRTATVIGSTSSGGSIYLITTQDSTAASNTNAYSALRTNTDFTRRAIVEKVTAQWMFTKGFLVGSGAYGMTADGKAKTSGMTAGDYVAGYQGAAIDSAGNAEFESIFARSYLKVFELIYNRLNALEGNTSFADVGTIETIEDNEDGSQTAVMRKRWDADFTAFQKGDVVYGYVNNLTSDSEVKEYYKAWAQVKDVDRDLNTLTLVPYPDEEVPAKVNHPMTAEMIITRWGNNIEANATTASNPDYVSFIVADGTETVSGVTQTKYRNTRQQSFYISCDDGNIVELMGVRKPTLEEGNYGAVFGQIPAGLLDDDTMAKLNTGQPYLYARGVIYQDLIQVNYKGLIRRTANYRGMWSYDTATSDNPYESTTSSYDTVTYNGVLWQCLINETTEEPSTTASGWGQMTASPEEVKVWTINPSANIVSIRRTEIRPETLSCTVTLATNSKTISIDDSATLLKKGAILQYSIDDVAWAEFLMGNEEPIELEDGSGYIETESGTEYITIGGDNVSTDLIGDRIIFRLIDKTSGDELARTHVPVVKDGARGAFTSTVFVRCSEQPVPPSGGTYENPIPDWFQINKEWFQWSDGIPEGDAILWASSRVFSDSEETPWSTPSQMTDTSYYDVEFSDVDEEPGNPTDNPDNWYDPTDDAGKVDFTKMLWRAEKVCRNGEWGNWTIVRIKGEKGTSGQWTSYAFATIQSDGNPPARPTDSDKTIPDGWSDAPTAEGVWYMSKATIDGATAKPIADTDGNYWSEPVQCTAEDGVNGSHVDFKYRAYAETDTVELTEAQQSQRNPEGWKDTPPTLSVGQVLYMIQATIQDDKLKGTWSTPVRISGERGDDGTDGASYTVNLLDGTNCGTDNWNIYIGNANGWYAPQDDGTYLNAASGESIKPYLSEMVATEGKGVGLTIINSDGTPTIATDSLGIAFRYPVAAEKLIKGRTYTLSFRTGFGGTKPQKVLCDIKPINGNDYLAPQASAVINSIYDKLSVKFTLTANGTDISGDIYVNIRFVSMTWASSGSQGVVVGDIKLEEGDNDKPLWTKSEADKVGADGKDGKDAQSQFVSTVFLRQDDTPDTPQGGSFAQPLPDGEQWSDGIPSGTAKLWYSHRRFTSDGEAPQEDTWTTPAVLADSADFDVEYCAKAKYDSAPQGHPNTNTEWSNDASADAVWMATCSKSANGDWSEWVVAKIKGENGADAENYWLVVNPTSVNVDNYGDSSVINITARIMHQTGNGAVEEIDSEYTQEEAYCYYIEVIYSLNGKKTALILDGDSDKPVTVSATKAWEYVTFNLMKGYDGRYAATLQTVTVPFVANGITADWVSYVFKAADADGIPTQPTDSDKTIPDGWSDAPTAEGVWYMSKATIDGTTSLPKKDSNGDYWSAPVQCTAEDGENGEYTDFKYQAAKAGDLVAYNATSDNPGSGWRDTPYYLDYDSSIQQYIWMITAVKVNGKLKDGTTWSTPVRINGEDGKDGKDGEKGDKGDKGEDGIGSTTYQLIVSPQTVRVTASGEVYAISKTVTAYVVQTYGSKTDKLDTRTLLRDANLKLYVKGISQSDSDAIEITNGTSKDNLEVSIVCSNNEKAYWTSGGSITVDTKTQFDFILKKADTTTETEIARETVTLVADGAKGDKGEQGKQGEAGAAGERGQIGNMLYPAGVYNSATEYTSTGTLSPFVLYLNSYYYLLPNKTYCGEAAANGDPASDYANSSNPSWAKFQQFNAVFTELLMANFAKLASAVFSGDYMFSQKGTRRVMKNMWMSKAEGTKVGSTAVKNYSYTDIQLINGTYNGDTVEARFLITKDEDDTPSVELNGTTPVGWSVIPQERSSNDDVLWLITRTNSGSWSTPQKIVFDTSSTEGNTISLYAFQIRDIQAAKPIAESTTGGWLSAWSKYPSPVVYEDDGSYAEFDGSMELFEPNFSVDLMTGNVRANKGVFKGIVTNDTTVITPDNYLDYMTKSYFSAVNRTYYKLNLSKCANRIIFKDTTTKFNSDTMIFYTIQMPVFENDASYTDEYLEQVRSYIGTTLTIYNYSVATITIDCASAVGATSHSSTYLGQNQCISLRCVLNVNGIDECVVWETYGTANAIIASK